MRSAHNKRIRLKTLFKHSIFLLGILYALLISGCSVEKDTMTSKAYHNTLARYNGYFIGKETLKEVERKINAGSTNNFNRVLKVYPTVTPTVVSGINAELEEVIKKASLPIQRHKNSKWVDNSYTLIGRARYYKLDYDNASITFKYVNSKGEDDNDRHEALTWLLRTFTQTAQYDNAMSVVSYLGKQKLTEKNQELFSLAKAELYQTIEEQKSFLKSMNEAEAVVKNRSNQARVHFILGQLNQQSGNDADAYIHYKKSIRKSPTYEMAFYGKLYMTQVTDLNKKSYKQVMKYYKKLLRDEKNVEYKDKIYYEIGRFEYKQDKLPEAIDNLKLSLREDKNNPYQKAYTYLMMSEIYYDDLKNYRQASYYYDSTYAILDKNEKKYPEVKKRATILKEFVKQLEIIETEDSLQALARMDTAQLTAYIDSLITAQEKAEKEEEERKLRAQQNAQTSTANNNLNLLNNALGASAGNSTWYFYNSSSVDQGKMKFKQKWGDRALEDNWRRSNKEKVAQLEEEEEQDELAAENEDGGDMASANDRNKARLARKRKQQMKDIPFTPEQLEASNKRVEEALYILAGIYHLKLEEPKNGSDTYEKLIKRFPNFEDITEVYYTLYVINKELDPAKSDYYKNLLLNQYPNSVYAKLIIDPQYLIKNEQLNKMAQGQYAIAYDLHVKEYYDSSYNYCNTIITQFPESDIMDKIVFLNALNIGLQDTTVVVFKRMLEDFIRDYPSSELIPLANEYLKGVTAYMTDKISSNLIAPETINVSFIKNMKTKHMFVAVFNKGNVKKHQVINRFAQYNDANWASYGLKPVSQLYTDDKFIIQVVAFGAGEKAMNYYNTMNVAGDILEGIADVQFDSFVISDENYAIFHKGKYLEEYLSFFRENYILNEGKTD